jgi:hypothetical protein
MGLGLGFGFVRSAEHQWSMSAFHLLLNEPANAYYWRKPLDDFDQFFGESLREIWNPVSTLIMELRANADSHNWGRPHFGSSPEQHEWKCRDCGHTMHGATSAFCSVHCGAVLMEEALD